MNELERALGAYRSEVKPSSARREAMEAAVLSAGPASAGVITNVIGLLVGGAIGGAILAGILATRPEPSAPPEASPAAVAPELEPEPPRPDPVAPVAAPAPALAPEPAPPLPEPPASAPARAPARAPKTRSEPASPPDAIEDMKLLRRAEALLETDAKAALGLLRRHRANHPSSPLALERSALRILALCKAGDTTKGQAARDAFLEDNPTSPYAGRVKTACVDAD